MLIRYLLTNWGVERSYIDLGSHHPYAMSNTAIFYHDGWKGINVEVNPVLAELFYSHRSKDINLCVGVGRQEGDMTFYMFNDHDPRNGFNKDLIDAYLRENPAARVVKEIRVPVKTIQGILDEYNHGKCPSFMSIDIEGSEYDALSGFNLRDNGPIICDMEISRNKEELFQLMQSAGYFLYVKVGANYIWVRNEYKTRIMQ